MPTATLASWLQGPMGFAWEALSDAECDQRSDELVFEHACKWHKVHSTPEQMPDSIRTALGL